MCYKYKTQYEHYLDFLNWGDSGTSNIFTNFTETAMKVAYGDDIKSEGSPFEPHDSVQFTT